MQAARELVVVLFILRRPTLTDKSSRTDGDSVSHHYHWYYRQMFFFLSGLRSSSQAVPVGAITIRLISSNQMSKGVFFL